MLADIRKADERKRSAARMYLGFCISLSTRRQLRRAGAAFALSGLIKTGNEAAIAKFWKDEYDEQRLPCPAGYVIDGLFPGFVDAVNRDKERFRTHHWQAVPWANERWFRDDINCQLHAAHMAVALGNKGQIAFAPSIAKLARDQFTTMKPGRYLQRYFAGVLSEEQIKEWANQCATHGDPPPLHFIEGADREGWVRVYNNGPRSCMKGEDTVRVYAHEHSVLRLAYQMSGTSIISRAIVREDRKEYVRIYPTEEGVINTAMRVALESAGYTHGNLSGVLLDAIEHDHGGWVCPYLDTGNGCGTTNVKFVYREFDQRGYLLVGSGDMDGQTQNGYVGGGVECCECNECYDEDTMLYVEAADGEVCERCLDRHFTYAWVSRREQNYVRDHDVIYCGDTGEHYADEEAANAHDVYQCEECGDYYQLDNLVQTSRGPIHTRYAEHLDVDDSDGNSYAHRDDTVTTHDGRVIHVDNAVLRTVYFHEDDDIENDQTPNNTASQAA